MTRIGAFGNVGEARLIDTVGRAAPEHETPVAIAAIDIAVLVDLEIDARMAESRWAIALAAADAARPVAADAAGFDGDDFGRWNAHARRLICVSVNFN